MALNLVMAFAFVYGCAYYVLARGLIGRVMDADVEYAGRWQRPGLVAKSGNSLAILHILFAMRLPKPDYPAPLKWRLWTARIMLWAWPLVLLALLIVPELARV